MEDVVSFKNVNKSDIPIVGGKGANLGELTKIGAPVPPGFIVTSEAYYNAILNAGVLDRIKGTLFNLNVEDPVALERKAQICQDEIRNMQMPALLGQKIISSYQKLSKHKNPLVAVRSSATAEDLPDASFAGQQATFLNVKGEKELIKSVLNAWASLFEARAIFYRVQKNFDHFKVKIAVPIQIMVQSQTSGVMFTADPVTNDKKIIVIEAVWGLGEMIVSGQVTPDHFEVEKGTFEIKNKSIQKQTKQMIKSAKNNKIITVSKAYQNVQKLPDEKIKQLAKIGKKIEDHYFAPQDIEWAYFDKDLYIVQTRPITTLGNKQADSKEASRMEIAHKAAIILEGSPASPLIASGPVVIVRSKKELQKVKKGDVLVAQMTSPDYVPAMRRAVAVVTDRGGRTSHAAIVSRELGIASVVGTQNATQKLKEGMVVTVDGSKGVVYKGSFANKKDQVLKSTQEKKWETKKTATKLYVNLAEPELAGQIAARNVDGIGLLRAEFVLAQIGKHPKKFINENKQEEFINILAQNLEKFAKAFGKRPVIYRASDLKTNEYRNLLGGTQFEPEEANPMLGYRGAYRYLHDPDTFKLELEAIKKVREKYANLHLMVPFVRSPQELKAVRQMVENANLFEDKSFKFWMMAELPVNVISLEEFIKIGIDGVSIGSNDLTMLILGTDRDNEEVSGEFNEMDPAVLWALEKVVKTCAQHNITCSICGQAPSIYPELTQKLVNWGITSISVNPDRIEETRQIIYQAETGLLKK